MSRNKRIINPFKTPKTRRFFNNKRRIRLLTYGKTKDNDNFTWLYYGTKQKKSGSVVETRCRYVLGAFKEFPPHGKVLICFGLNPSTGVPLALERTVKKLSKIAFSCKDEDGNDKYDGWVMLNLFPLRNSNSKNFLLTLKEMSESEFDTLCNKNLKYINEILKMFPKKKVDILLAWGNSVENDKTGGLKRCIVDVDKALNSVYDKKWIESHVYTCYSGHGKVRTESEHPRHINLISLKNATLVLFRCYKKYINKIKENLRK